MGLLSQYLAHKAQEKRDEHLADIADRKNKQDLALSHIDAMMPMVSPEDQPALQQLQLDIFGTPVTKYDPSKSAKALGDIMAQSHSRATGMADMSAQKPVEPITFQIPQGGFGMPQMPQGNSMPPAPPPGQQALPNGGMPMAAAPNPILQRLQQFGYMPPGPPPPDAGAPPQMQGNAAPNPAGTPGMLTQTGMEGLHAPGSNVPGTVRPFIDPQRQMQAAVSQLNALGITDPRDIVNAINKHPLTTPPAREAQINEIAFMGYMQKAGGDPTKAFEMFQGALHPEATAKELTPEMQAFNKVLKETGDPMEAFRQVKAVGGDSSELTKEQRTANSAYEAFRKTTDPKYKLTPVDYGKAVSWYDEEKTTPDQAIQRKLQAASLVELQKQRQLEEAKLSLNLQELKATRGPDAVNAIVNQMKADPDIFFSDKLDPVTRNLVGQAWSQQTGLPPPREVPTPVKTKEANSVIAANSVARLKKMLAENPVILQRMGKWDGRVGNLEQAIGDTRGLSPQDSQAIQNFRSSVNYLFFQEAQSVMQRPAQQFMEELRASSPSMKQGLPLFLGALDAVQGISSNNIQSANDYRFNRAPGSATSSTPPNPPAGVNPFRVPKK